MIPTAIITMRTMSTMVTSPRPLSSSLAAAAEVGDGDGDVVVGTAAAEVKDGDGDAVVGTAVVGTTVGVVVDGEPVGAAEGATEETMGVALVCELETPSTSKVAAATALELTVLAAGAGETNLDLEVANGATAGESKTGADVRDVSHT